MQRVVRYCLLLFFLLAGTGKIGAQPLAGSYRNPIVHADYSDPDAIRVGDDYYMVASSFNHVPGLPVLHSKDLVQWELIGYALQRLVPEEHYRTVQHGGGVWAPAIRHHNGLFYIFFPDPDFGIYIITASDIRGPWSEPFLLLPGKGLIDPCPFWDNNGKAYLVHAYAGSRAGIKSILVVREMDPGCKSVTGAPVLVYDGGTSDPTVEGPKLYKRNGYYYIFAPAGGVTNGWQLALRSRSVYGPYERKVVLHQGTSRINGPHQGAWVQTPAGADWFLHFQDKGAYGRILHLQPMRWQNDWPVMGEAGQPVQQFQLPHPGNRQTGLREPEQTGRASWPLTWQWAANPGEGWGFLLSAGGIRLYARQQPDSLHSLWMTPNILSRMFPAEEFTATATLDIRPHTTGERFGLIITGRDYATLELEQSPEGMVLRQMICRDADKGGREREIARLPAGNSRFYLQVRVAAGAVCRFYFSENGSSYQAIGQPFTARPGVWVGARLGLFAVRSKATNDAGYADLHRFIAETR
ncbi:MAG TPA: glycoside hydrolase 43 family protein [Lacibacter sp.]|nr:glycoside hydrolase 43 family protein [Lacibacter sp.]HMO89204.1 glycoside hydrolase 43 family protein [Lacibacter sp.]HMP88283.1 glycoside hydrolase 43 family protein [Lacibacter sp.]